MLVRLTDTAPRVPAQQVTVDNAQDALLVCEEVSQDGTGTTAKFRLAGGRFSSDVRKYHTGEIKVFAANYGESFGDPLFIGCLETSGKQLRGHAVNLTGKSWISRLRDRSLCFCDDWKVAPAEGETRGFGYTTEQDFYSTNPYKNGEYKMKLFQPWEILEWVRVTAMDVWWQSKVMFMFDARIKPLEPEKLTLSRWEWDTEAEDIVLATYEQEQSPVGDQVFRMASWGQVIDFVASLMPGVQTFERFRADGVTEIWFAYPEYQGGLEARCAYGNLNWSDLGATVTDLSVQTDSVDVVNRVAGYGSAAACTVTVVSESSSDGLLGMAGLIPDWNLYNTDEVPSTEYLGVIGCGTLDYDYRTYSETAQYRQRIVTVLANPDVAKADSPSYRDGYEWVGRRWRLPNWFNYTTIGQGRDMFTNPKNGDQVNFQVFVEVAREQPYEDELYGPIWYQYGWERYQFGVEFDWKNKTLLLETCPRTHWIDNFDCQLIDPAVEGYKLCRIALTFTYQHPNYMLYADTYLINGSTIQPSRETALQTGQGIIFERPDLGYSQLTSINMPLDVQYCEVVPTTIEEIVLHGGKPYQVAYEQPTPYKIAYPDLIVHVHATESRTKSYTADSGVPLRELGEGRFDAPVVIRDDSKKLWKAVNETYALRGGRPRQFNISLDVFTKGVQRGMMTFVTNMQNFASDLDCVDSVTHDLKTSRTTFTTTNKPSDTLQRLAVATTEGWRD